MPYGKSFVNFEINESPVRSAYPVNTLPPITPPTRPVSVPPVVTTPGHASGSSHDPLCQTDMRKMLDVYIK